MAPVDGVAVLSAHEAILPRHLPQLAWWQITVDCGTLSAVRRRELQRLGRDAAGDLCGRERRPIAWMVEHEGRMVLLIKPTASNDQQLCGSPAQAARAGPQPPGVQVPGFSTEVTRARYGLSRR